MISEMSDHLCAVSADASNEKPTALGEAVGSSTARLGEGGGGDAEPVTSIAALDDDHLGTPFGLLDDLGRGAVRPTEDDDVEVMVAMMRSVPAAEIIVEVTPAGFGNGGERNRCDNGGEGGDCKLLHGDGPFGFR